MRSSDTRIYVVVLCGGNGTRLWPLSSPSKPKQFLDLIHGKSSDSTVGGYKSRQQMIDAMKDPRYINDPAYRAEVEAKVVAANF